MNGGEGGREGGREGERGGGRLKCWDSQAGLSAGFWTHSDFQDETRYLCKKKKKEKEKEKKRKRMQRLLIHS